MRIAVNARFLLPGKLEGIGWVTYELMKRITTNHPEHEFLFLFDRPYDPKFLFSDNVRGIEVFPPARHPILFYLWFDWAIPRVLQREKADLFISLDGFLSLRTQVPTLLMIHDVAHVHFPEQVGWFDRKYYQYFIPRFVARAQRILTVSHFSKTDMLAHYQLSADKIQVIHNGCREHFVPLAAAEIERVRRQYSDGKPYFFYVGALHPRKNVDRLIRAFDQFKANTGAPHQLLIGGRMAWKSGPIKSAYEAAKHQSDIRFLGYLPDEELPSVMGAAFALTYVSLFEGFGLPVLEALNCGVPVITSDVSSLPEVAGEAGLLVDPRSVAAIAGAMEQLATDAELRDKCRQLGLIQAQQFDWEKAAKQLWSAVEQIITSSGY